MDAGGELMTFEVDEIIGECDLDAQVTSQSHDIPEALEDGGANRKAESLKENGMTGVEEEEEGTKEEGRTENDEAKGDEKEDAAKDSEKAHGESKESDSQEEGVECGFLVDRISTIPYQKALDRGEIPFCAFAPISTPDLYLLRIQNCADATRHMLVPASKDDVFNTPGALKSVEDEQEPGNDESINYRVAIVAIARQIYSEEDKQLVVSVDPPLKKDKRRIQAVKFLTLDKFADFAFLGFDGNVSEFAGNQAAAMDKEPKTGITSEENRLIQPACDDASVSTPAIPSGIKSPPKAPLRRGRGGRRRLSRKSPFRSPMRHTQMPFFPVNFQQLSTVALPLQNTLPNDFSQLIKMEQADGESQQYVTMAQGYQMQMPQVTDPSIYEMNVKMPTLQVPAPVTEVTISTSETGAESTAQATNNDLVTIAFDQLISSEVSSADPQVSEKSSRGGRRPGPGRKPGRKPHKERNQETEETGESHPPNPDAVPVVIPKRRGRPPKNRVQMHVQSVVESENSNSNSAFDYRDDSFEKRVKLQFME